MKDFFDYVHVVVTYPVSNTKPSNKKTQEKDVKIKQTIANGMLLVTHTKPFQTSFLIDIFVAEKVIGKAKCKAATSR